jgi:hypothetical protein
MIEHKISDVLADPSHDAHEAVKEMMAKLESGEINMCGCMGPMYGEPYCPCKMEQMALGRQMAENPLRVVEEARASAQWEKFMENGGREWLSGGKLHD